MKTLGHTQVFDGGKRSVLGERNPKLTTMGVAAKQKVPIEGAKQFLGIRIVAEYEIQE